MQTMKIALIVCALNVIVNAHASSSSGHGHLRKFGRRKWNTSQQSSSIHDIVQVEYEGYFDIVEQPEQFMEAPNTKAKSHEHVQRFMAADDDVLASGDKKKKPHKKNLPAFLFSKEDLAKIHSNSQNIVNDEGRNIFYEHNIVVEPSLSLEKIRAGKQQKIILKGDHSKGMPKEKLRRMSFKRRHRQRHSSPVLGRALHFDYSHRIRRAVTVKKERIWDYAVIPYEIDNSFSGAHKALFQQAMRHWENFTCIKFVERDPKVHPDYIFFTVNDCGCCSYVGKRGGRQDISIGRNCEKFGIVVHELGHVTGFWHEHTRTDRDQHIIINTSNILKGQEYNFDVLTSEDVDSLGQPYDFNSIMHYAKNTFSKSVYLDTIQPIGISSDTERLDVGQRIRLSRGDIAQANLLYKCAACGKTFQQNSGQIMAPHYLYSGHDMEEGGGSGDYDGEFERSLEQCEWRITATNGERIILQVHKLNLLHSTDCSVDYLEVRDGYWRKSPVIKRICGNATSETIRSDSSRMLINYVNHNAIKGFRGFIADFEVVCGGDIFLTKEDRRIDSPNYPLEYLPDKECVWRITVPVNHQVAPKFQSFELENHESCIYDYVEIRDGNHSESTLIGIFCGKALPNIKSNTNQMYIKFVSDGSVQSVGFSAMFMQEVDECKFGNHGCQHECINTLGSYQCGCFAGYELQANGRSCEDACGGIIDASTPNSTLYSPSYPHVYPISKNCTWEVVASANNAVFLNFTHFDLEGTKLQYKECNYDYLVVYSKLRDSRLKKIGKFCGNELPPILNSEENILRLEFYSDKSVQHTGFAARIMTDTNECSLENGGCQHNCRNTFGSYMCSCRNGYSLHEDRHNCTETKCKFEITNSYGSIQSPNFPDDYPRNTYCYWHFRTVLGHRVQLTFHEFEVENHQECIYDYVEIYDGKSENSSTLGTFCGGREPYAVLASSTDMFMVLKTDLGLQRRGFNATYSTQCGGYLRATNSTQVFYSHPRYGRHRYKRNMYCKWQIESDPKSSVKIKFLRFEIEYSERCKYDFIDVTEELPYANHGRYCGNIKPPTIVSYSDSLYIRFKSDSVTSLRGFAISFVAVEPPPDDDIGDDLDSVTPFPGHMKSVYYA